MAYYFFYDKTNSPIVYYSSVIVNITALLWSVIVKEYKPLEEHILKYRQDQWLVPCSENYKENKVLRSIWLVCFIGPVVFSFVCQWGGKITTKSVVIIKIAMFLAFMRKLLIPVY